MSRVVPFFVRLVAVLAGIHAIVFSWALMATDAVGGVVILVGVFAALSASTAAYGLWRLEGWALRAILAWAFAAPLFALTLFASLFPDRVGSTSWRSVLEASGLWLLFMGGAGWQVRSVMRGTLRIG